MHDVQRQEARVYVIQVHGENKHTYIHTGSGMCVCVTNNVYVSLGWRGMQRGA